MAKVIIPSIKLNTGRDMPALGYGTWLGVNASLEFDVTAFPDLVEAMSYAIDIGYRHVDTAHLYRVEPEVGAVVNQKIKEGVVKREDMFITTKVWNHNHSPSKVVQSVRDSLRRLQMDYVDLALMHWPMSISQDKKDEKIDFLETWAGFEQVFKEGLAKAIGVSNFNEEQLKRLLAHCKVKPATNQVEINLNLGQSELVDYCRSQDIVIVAYSPFGTMVPGRAAPGSPEPKLNNPSMVAIAKNHGKTVTQIALRYLYERGIVSLPKTVTKSRVLENASIFDFKLTPEEVATIAAFDNGFRTVRPLFWQHYDNYPFDKVSVDTIPDIPECLLTWKNGANGDIE